MTKAKWVLALLALPLYPAIADVPAATKTHQSYDVIREGTKIGTNVVDVERRGDAVSVKISTKISVKIMYIEAYRFNHEETESWKGGLLVAFNSHTDDNGKDHNLAVTPAANKLDMLADGKHTDAPLNLRPASLWDRGFNAQNELFDTATGKLMAIKTKDLGDEKITANGVAHDTRHYKISGDFNRDVWFDGDTLVRLKLQGSDHSIIDSDLTQMASLPLADPSADAKSRHPIAPPVSAPPPKH
jgi:hypothetical protein